MDPAVGGVADGVQLGVAAREADDVGEVVLVLRRVLGRVVVVAVAVVENRVEARRRALVDWLLLLVRLDLERPRVVGVAVPRPAILARVGGLEALVAELVVHIVVLEEAADLGLEGRGRTEQG